MLHEVSGDILMSGAQLIAHGVAPNDHFTNGLALALRERWPAMYKDFRHYCHQAHPRPGELWAWGGPGGVRIVNLLTQDGAHDRGARPGRASTENVNQCLRHLRKLVEEENVQSLALPRLATGVGGLDWSDVEPLIRNHLALVDAEVFVYSRYEPGVKASEP